MRVWSVHECNFYRSGLNGDTWSMVVRRDPTSDDCIESEPHRVVDDTSNTKNGYSTT
jgi:hypothetical protein